MAEDEQFDGMDISQPYYLQRLEEVYRRNLGNISDKELSENFLANSSCIKIRIKCIQIIYSYKRIPVLSVIFR